MRLVATTFFLFGAVCVSSALAQEANEQTDPKTFTVNANFQARLPIDSAATTADITKAIAQANQSLGEIANRECDVLAAAFKANCNVAQLNMAANVNDRRRQNFNNEFGGNPRIVTVSLNATYALTTTSDAKAAPAAQ